MISQSESARQLSVTSHRRKHAPWWRRLPVWFWQLVSGHDIFISYSRTDAFMYAEQLYGSLTRKHVNTFLDEAKLEAGSLLPRRIRRAARRSIIR